MTSDMTAMVTFFYAFIFIFVITNGMNSVTGVLGRNVDVEESKEDLDASSTDGKHPKIKGKLNKKSKGVMDDDTISMGSESLLSHSENLSSFGGKKLMSGPSQYSSAETTNATTNSVTRRNKESSGGLAATNFEEDDSNSSPDRAEKIK